MNKAKPISAIELSEYFHSKIPLHTEILLSRNSLYLLRKARSLLKTVISCGDIGRPCELGRVCIQGRLKRSIFKEEIFSPFLPIKDAQKTRNPPELQPMTHDGLQSPKMGTSPQCLPRFAFTTFNFAVESTFPPKRKHMIDLITKKRNSY